MPTLQESNIAFIGGGNMASAIIHGLVAQGTPKENITVSEPWDVNRAKMAQIGVRTTTANADAGANADIVILAVKPQIAKSVCQELGGAWASTQRSSLPVVVSIAAGITLESLKIWITAGLGARGGEGQTTPPIVRVMPNTPALVNEGASGAYASESVTGKDKELVNALLGSVSKATEWVEDEKLLDVVTGLSGEFTIPGLGLVDVFVVD